MARAPSPIRCGLVASTWEGAFAQAFVTWTSGVFIVDFARKLGAGNQGLGLLAALPFFAQTLQLATAWMFERSLEGRRSFTTRTLVLARLLWLVPAALALGLLPRSAGLGVFLAVVATSSLLLTAGAHGWQSWMVDLVPVGVRGRYFGFRSVVAAVVAIAAAFAGGRVLDAFEASGPGLSGFGVVYALAAGAGVLAWVAIRAQHHPAPRQEGPPAPVLVLWREIWAKPEHRRIFAFFVAWNAALGVAVPFWAKYMKEGLGLSAGAIGVQGTIGSLVGAALFPMWGRLIDRVGLRPVLLANALSISAIPFLWLFARPGFVLPVWIDAFAVGVFWTGFNLAALNVPLSAAPARGRAAFIGVFGALTGVAMGTACLVGGAVASALGDGERVVLGLTLSTPQLMFLASGVLRFASLPLAMRMPDPREKSVVFLFGVMGTAVRQRLNLGRLVLTAPWRKK